MGRSRGNGVRWIAGAFLVFVIFSAARIGVADLLVKHAENEMGARPADAVRPDATALDEAYRALDRARRIAPDDPAPYENLARLALLRTDAPDIGGAKKNALLKESLAPVRRAIALCPVSPYGWAILLRIKQGLGEYDAEFRRALSRATTLGPWEPEVQPIVADAGLSAWAVLPEAEREMLREDFVRGMKRQADTMLAIARAHHDDCRAGHNDAGCKP
jgi:hypothetical protein